MIEFEKEKEIDKLRKQKEQVEKVTKKDAEDIEELNVGGLTAALHTLSQWSQPRKDHRVAG